MTIKLRILSAIKEFNRYRDPEVKARLIKISQKEFIVQFKGPFCYSCGFCDYFDDLRYILMDYDVETKISDIEEIEFGAIVKFEIGYAEDAGNDDNKDKSLYNIINDLKKKIGHLISKRINEFKEIGLKSNHDIFKELCFCILTANFNAEKSIKIQSIINDGFINLPEKALATKLKELGYRYPNIRARYIVEARKYADNIKEIIMSFKFIYDAREWLVKNVKGIGYKEASHFLRNIGYTDIAILDFHIINFLHKYGIIKDMKRITKRKYIDIENILRGIAKRLNITLAELDLYLWYIETGKILK